MRRVLLLLAVALAAVAVPASPPAAPASAPLTAEEAVERALVRWGPVLIADQRRLFTATRVYLRNPEDPSSVRAARRRLQLDAAKAEGAFRGIAKGPTGRDLGILGSRSLVAGAHEWERFITGVVTYLARGVRDPAAWRRIHADHDGAESQFRRGWQDFALLNERYGRPLGRAAVRPPAAPEPVKAAPDPVPDLTGRWASERGVYDIRQAGDTVTWVGHSSGAPGADGRWGFYHEFSGTVVDERYVVGRFRDVPELSVTRNSGDLVVEIVSQKLLRKVAGYAGVTSSTLFADSAWTR